MSEISTEYVHKVLNMVKEIEATQSERVDLAAKWFADSILEDGLVHVYGSGHSRMGVEEMFPRYGSFPGFHPIIELSTTYYGQVVGTNGLSQVMFLENVEGFAPHILENFILKPQDVFLLFSTSGTGNVVIDMAIEAKKRGLKVVVVTGLKNSERTKSSHSTGKKLFDFADLVLDTCVPVGDAAIHIEGLDHPVGPLSTIANATLVNMLKVTVAQHLTNAGKPPKVITGGQSIGTDASKATFREAIEEYRRTQR